VATLAPMTVRLDSVHDNATLFTSVANNAFVTTENALHAVG